MSLSDVFFVWRAGRDKSATRLYCLSTQRLRLSVPDCAPLRYKTVHQTVLLNAPCPLRLRAPPIQLKKDEPTRWISSSFLARWEGLEPPTFWFVAKHSIRLSYQRKCCQYSDRHNILSQLNPKVKQIFHILKNILLKA